MTDIINNLPSPHLANSDHDLITALVVNVQNIKESQDRFHIDIKAQIDDLKNNFAGRLETVEAIQRSNPNLYPSKIEQNKFNDSLDSRISTLETWQNRIIGGLILFNIILGIVVAYLSSK